MTISEVRCKLDTLRDFLRIISKTNIRSISMSGKGYVSYVWVDETFDKDKVNKQISETFDNSVVNEIHIYGCLPKSYNIEEKCYLGFLDAKYDIEANTIHQIFVNCIEFWFKHELGLKIKVSSLENEDDENGHLNVNKQKRF